MEKIEFVENEDETVVTIITENGQFVGSREYPSGHFKNPLSDSEFRQKATEAIRGILEEEQWNDVNGFIHSLDDQPSITPVYDMVIIE
jgi:2-methylcitrate dehydratase PrpD